MKAKPKPPKFWEPVYRGSLEGDWIEVPVPEGYVRVEPPILDPLCRAGIPSPEKDRIIQDWYRKSSPTS